MHLPWKKSKSKSKTGRISRLVSDLQQSPKRGGSLVVETGFPTSLIDLFVKNRNRLKKPPSSKKRSKDNNDKSQARLTAAPDNSHPPLQRLVSSPSPPSKPLRRGKSLPQKLDLASVTEKLTASKSEVSFSNRGGLTSEVRNDGEEKDGEIGGRCGGGGGGGCFFMVVAIKVFVVAVLALSTKKLAVGITLSAFALLFLELAVARVFTLLNLCPNAAQIRLNYLIVKLIGKKQREKIEESTTQERRNTVSFEIIEESMEETQAEEKISNFEDTSKLVKAKPLEEETVRDVVSTKEKSKSSKLKSKIVKKIVPKKLRSYKKKKKMMKIKKEEEYVVEEEEEGYVTEVASLFSESEISEISSNPPLLESCCEEIQEEEDYDGSKGDITKVIVLIVIVLAGLLSGKVLAFVLTFSSCLILKLVCNKSQTSL